MHAAVIMHRNHVAVVMHHRCRDRTRCSGGDAGEHRSGQAERYEGWKDGSPDAHDSSKATLGLRQSARLGPRGTFAALWELLPLLAKVMPFRVIKKMLRYFRIKLPRGFSC
jgi:hypothetical protein